MTHDTIPFKVRVIDPHDGQCNQIGMAAIFDIASDGHVCYVVTFDTEPVRYFFAEHLERSVVSADERP